MGAPVSDVGPDVGPVVAPGVVWVGATDDVDVSMATVVPSVSTVGASLVGASARRGTWGGSGWMMACNVWAD